MRRIIPRSVTYGLTTSSVSSALSSSARDRVGDRPVAAGRVVEDDGRNGIRPGIELREQRLEIGRGNLASEPPEAGEEHELQLCDHRAGDAEEQVVEAAVLEVVLDAGAADPADSTVDDHDLAVIDVAEPAQVPAELAVASQQADRGTRLRRSDDADLDARRP